MKDIYLIGDAYCIKHSVDYHVEKEEDHVHEEYEILFPVFGSVSFQVETRHYNLKPGNILIIPPGISHKYDKKNKNVYERVILLLKGSLFQRLQKLSGLEIEDGFSRERLIQIDSIHFEKLYGILGELESMMKSREFTGLPLGETYLTQMMAYLNHEDQSSGIQNEKERDWEFFSRSSQIRRFVDQNLGDALSLEKTAEQFNISKFYLSHEFKKAFGISFHQYVRRRRLETARVFLERGYSVNEAYLASGFVDYANFSKAFKKEYGASPREFRKQKNTEKYSRADC